MTMKTTLRGAVVRGGREAACRVPGGMYGRDGQRAARAWAVRVEGLPCLLGGGAGEVGREDVTVESARHEEGVGALRTPRLPAARRRIRERLAIITGMYAHAHMHTHTRTRTRTRTQVHDLMAVSYHRKDRAARKMRMGFGPPG